MYVVFLTCSSFMEYKQGTIRCKIQENVGIEEHGFRRRDVIQSLGVAIGMVRSILSFFIFMHFFLFFRVVIIF